MCNVFSIGRVHALSGKCGSSNVMKDNSFKIMASTTTKTIVILTPHSAMRISCNPVQHSRTKHIHTRYHFIKEQVENGIIELYFVRTEYQLADMFTKALPEDRFKYLVRRIGMRCLTPADLEVVRLGINPMIQPEPEDLPKDNPKLEIAVLRTLNVVSKHTEYHLAELKKNLNFNATYNLYGFAWAFKLSNPNVALISSPEEMMQSWFMASVDFIKGLADQDDKFIQDDEARVNCIEHNNGMCGDTEVGKFVQDEEARELMKQSVQKLIKCQSKKGIVGKYKSEGQSTAKLKDKVLPA
ncbi:hypothetical protein Tco_1448241 [Tanacetum coccineum]